MNPKNEQIFSIVYNSLISDESVERAIHLLKAEALKVDLDIAELIINIPGTESYKVISDGNADEISVGVIDKLPSDEELKNLLTGSKPVSGAEIHFVKIPGNTIAAYAAYNIGAGNEIIDNVGTALKAVYAFTLGRSKSGNAETTETMPAEPERISAVINNLQSGILVENEHRQIMMLNEKFNEMFGIPAPPAALIGADCSTSAEDSKGMFKDPEAFVKRIDIILAEKKLVKGELLELADGRFFERDYIPIFISNVYKGHLWQYSDVTFRVKAKLQLQENEERFRTIVENANDIIYKIDIEGRFTYVSPSAEKITGFETREIIGRHYLDFVKEEYRDKAQAFYRNQLQKGTKNSYLQFPVVTKNGEVRWLGQNVRLIETAGTISELHAVARDITRQKQIEDALKESREKLAANEERLKLALSAADQGLWDWNIISDNVYFDAKWAAIHGYKQSELQMKLETWSKTVFEEDKKAVFEKIDEVLGSSEDLLYEIEYRAVQRDNSLITILSRGRIIERDSDGKPVRMIGTVQDITERKKSENALAESAARINSILQTAVDGIITIDTSGRIDSFNPAAEKMFGYKREEVEGNNISIIMPEPHHSNHDTYLRNYLETGERKILGKDREVTGKRKNGTLFPVDLSISEVMIGNKKLFTGIVRDITERKDYEEELKNHRARLEAVVENTGDMIWSVDKNFNFIIANSNFKHSYKAAYDIDVQPGVNHIGTMPDYNKEEWKGFYEKALAGEQFSVEREFNVFDSVIHAGISFNPIEDESGSINGVTVYSRDITEQKKIIDELIDARKNAEASTRAKERFLAHMSHEIRTPMNAVTGLTHLLMQMNPTEDQAKFLEAIVASSENLLVIINDILDFSKIEAGKIEFTSEDFSVYETVDQVIQTVRYMANEKGIDIIKVLDSEIPDYIKGDQVRLNQILLNLVSNAVKFTDSGEIKIFAERKKVKNGKCRLNFRVKDTGTGIKPEDLDTIFKSFEQLTDKNTKKQLGTGLGLAIVKNLVEQQGGEIYVKSEWGKGSEFGFELPFEKAELSVPFTPGEADKPGAAASLAGLRVLIVEDNDMNQLVVANVLGLWGISYDIAPHGKAALELLEQNQYDLILMDLSMPVMDGYETAEYIRNKTEEPLRSIPIIALTASAMVSAQDKIYEVGMNEFITKPFKPDTLKNKLLQMFGEREKPVTETVVEEKTEQKTDTGASLINLEYISEIADGSEEFIMDMINKFIDQNPVYIDELRSHIDKEDWQEVRKIAHKMKPTVNYMGIDSASELIKNIEAYSENGINLKEIPGLFVQLKTICEKAVTELESILKNNYDGKNKRESK